MALIENGEKIVYGVDDIMELHKPLAFELEAIYLGVQTYMDSSYNTSNNKILFRGGGYDDQPYLFWEMVEIAESGINEFINWSDDDG